MNYAEHPHIFKLVPSPTKGVPAHIIFKDRYMSQNLQVVKKGMVFLYEFQYPFKAAPAEKQADTR